MRSKCLSYAAAGFVGLCFLFVTAAPVSGAAERDVASMSPEELASVCTEGDPRTAGLSAAQRDLLKEYAASYNQLVDFYTNIYIEAIRRGMENKPDRTGERKVAREMVFRANGGTLFRMDIRVLNPEDESPTGETVDHFLTPRDGEMRAERADPTKPFAITFWEPGRNRGHWVDYLFHQAPYSASGMWMKGLILVKPSFSKTGRIDSIICRDEGGERVVVIDISGISNITVPGAPYGGHFVFYRDRSWALKEAVVGAAKLTGPDDEVEACRCEYEGMQDGVPLLKRAEYWFEVGPAHTKRLVQRFEIRKIVPGPVPEAEFSVSAIGIRLGGEDTHWMPKFIGGLLTALLVVACIIVWLRARQRSSQTR